MEKNSLRNAEDVLSHLRFQLSFSASHFANSDTSILPHSFNTVNLQNSSIPLLGARANALRSTIVRAHIAGGSILHEDTIPLSALAKVSAFPLRKEEDKTKIVTKAPHQKGVPEFPSESRENLFKLNIDAQKALKPLRLLKSSIATSHISPTTTSLEDLIDREYSNAILSTIELTQSDIALGLLFSDRVNMKNMWSIRKRTLFSSFSEKFEKKSNTSFNISTLLLSQGATEKERAGCYGSVVIGQESDVLLSPRKLRQSLKKTNVHLKDDENVTNKKHPECYKDIEDTLVLLEYITGERKMKEIVSIENEEQKLLISSLCFLERQARVNVRALVSEDRAEYYHSSSNAHSHPNDGSVLSYAIGYIKARTLSTKRATVSLWSIIYIMIRCGHFEEAKDFAKKKLNDIGDLLGLYLDRNDRPNDNKLLIHYKTAILSESDPYKLLVLNVLGGDDISSSSKFFSVLETPLDKLWFYLHMRLRGYQIDFNNTENSNNNANKNDNIAKIQSNSTTQMTNPFSLSLKLTLTSPILTAQARFAALQFEEGLSYLLNFPSFFVDAVHFGIVLAQRDLLTSSKISHLIQAYVAVFRAMISPQLALKYTFLAPKRMQSETITQLIVCVAESGQTALEHFVNQISAIISTASTPLTSEEFTEILSNAARQCADDRTLVSTSTHSLNPLHSHSHSLIHGLSRAAAWLYAQAGKYEDSLIQTISLFTRVVTLERDNADKKEIQSLVSATKHEILPRLTSKSSQYVECFNILYSLGYFFNEFHAKQYDSALSTLHAMHFVPTTTDTRTISQYAEKFNIMPSVICELLPSVLRSAVKAVKRRWKDGKHQGNVALCTEMGQIARAFVLFVGMLSIAFPQSTAAKLIEVQTTIT